MIGRRAIIGSLTSALGAGLAYALLHQNPRLSRADFAAAYSPIVASAI